MRGCNAPEPANLCSPLTSRADNEERAESAVWITRLTLHIANEAVHTIIIDDFRGRTVTRPQRLTTVEGLPIWAFSGTRKTRMVSREDALPGRDTPMPVPERHTVLGTSLAPPLPARPALPVRKRESPAVLVMLGLFAVAALVGAGILAHAAYDERAQAGQFLAAPRCAGNAAPAGDCVAWQTRTVSRVNASKSGLHIDLSGGPLHLWYLHAPGWIDELGVGEPVPVLVWEDSAQALRDPEGHVFYSENSALHQGDSDIGLAFFMSGSALLMMVSVFALSPWFQRRSSRYVPLAIVLADAGVSGAVGGAVIQGANSVNTGVKTGVILFCAIGIVAPVVMRLRWTRKLAAHG